MREILGKAKRKNITFKMDLASVEARLRKSEVTKTKAVSSLSQVASVNTLKSLENKVTKGQSDEKGIFRRYNYLKSLQKGSDESGPIYKGGVSPLSLVSLHNFSLDRQKNEAR